MNNGRVTRFIFLISTIMLGAVLLQNMMGKKPNAGNAPADGVVPANVDQLDADKEGENQGDQQDKALPENGQADIGEPDAKADDDGNANGNGDGEAKDEQANPPVAAPTPKDDYVQMGSLDESGKDRYLVTVNKLAGTIHRVELNFRDKRSGNYKYRDLVWEGGYLGELEGIKCPDGCQIQTVGKGTPADKAGLKRDDIILAINDEPVLTPEGFEQYLNENTKPDTTITLDYKRDGNRNQVEVQLTTKPISVIRPEPEDILSRNEPVKTTFDYPESFVLSLIKPMTDVSKAWPDLDAGMRNATWQVSQATDDLIELEYKISQTQLDKVGIQGPITVYKRYNIPAFAEEDLLKLDSRTFHLDLEIEVRNGSGVDQKLAYELDGPTGLTAETWWFANKIHGRQTAIGYIAGARDVVGSTAYNSYIFFGCPELVKNAKKADPKVSYICEPLSPLPERQLNFAGVDSHYFNVTLLPLTAEEQAFEVLSLTAHPNNRFGQIPVIPKNVRTQKLVDCTFQMVAPLDIPAGGSYKQTFEVFCGPKDESVLKHYKISDVRTFGWFSWCSVVLLKLLHFFHYITFGWSYGLAIVMLTILVRCFMIPFSRKAALNAQMMQHLAPQMKEITAKYPEDMEKRAAAQRELYKKHNFNPFGGCFMMFFQLPIFYGLYKGLNVDIALRDQPLIPGMEWCSNLAAPDQFMFWRDWMPTWLGDETGWLGPFLNILPLLTMVLFIAQQKLFTPPATDDQQKMMQRMMTFMMVAMGVMFFKVPAGLCIYFITSSLWGIIERKLLPKPKLDTEKLGLTDSDAPKSRADRKAEKEMERAEEMRQAELEDRKARNAERKKRLKKRGRGGSDGAN